MSTLHAFDFLAADAAPGDHRLFVLFGDDRFLQLLVRNRLLDQIAPGEADFDTTILEGDSVDWSDLMDQLATVSLFGQSGARVAVVEEADGFVKRFRAELEQLIANPPGTGRLVLLVSSWPANTRLYKALDKSACQIHCGLPQTKRGRGKSRDASAICKWIVARAADRHGLELTQPLARQLLDIVEWNLGQADQELAKLALFGSRVDEATLQQVVGGWRAQSIWEAAAAATQGNTSAALEHLANLLQSGEHPLALFGPLSWSLRRYGRLWEIISRQTRHGQKPDLSLALGKAGFRDWNNEMEIAESSVRQLGRQRVKQFYHWLQETDLSLKGTHSDPHRARFALELLFFLMVRPSNRGPF